MIHSHRRVWQIVVIAAWIVVEGCWPTSAAQNPPIPVTAVGPVSGRVGCRAFAINNNGDIAAVAYNEYYGDNNVPFVWHTHKPPTVLEAMAGGRSYINDINESGQACGAIAGSSGPFTAVRVDIATGVPTSFVSLAPGHPQYDSATPGGLNNRGDVVGVAYHPTLLRQHPVLWPNGQTTPIDLTPGGATHRYGSDTVDLGDILTSGDATGSSLVLRDGSSANLQLPIGGSLPVAWRLNQQGDPVGWYQRQSPTRYAAAKWQRTPTGTPYPLESLPSVPGFLHAQARAINIGGECVGQAYNTTSDAIAVWWDFLGTAVNLNTLIDPASGWVLRDATGINDFGQICGRGEYQGQERAFALNVADTDGDGLFDSWETNGIPCYPTPGSMVTLTLPGADPMHKDLYVEVDSMAGVTLLQDAIDQVVNAFEAAPVDNPDNDSGIHLHVISDDTQVPFEAVTPIPNYQFPELAYALRNYWFGTQPERSDPGRASLLAAKARAYRYCLVMSRSAPSIGGHAELAGDDMILYLGGNNVPFAQAAIFMHELGHSLGLHHGGGDDINGKPNYPSIMNYVLSYPEGWNQAFWRLDYSGEQLPTLDEAGLDEHQPVGVARYDTFNMPFFGIVPQGAACFPPDQQGQPFVGYLSLDPFETTDFSLDCDREDAGVTQDLNYLPEASLPGMLQASPGQLLVGWNDWANLEYRVGAGGGAFAGAPPSDELTEDQLVWMRQNFPAPPCAVDRDRNGLIQPVDLALFVTGWFQGLQAGTLQGDWDHNGALQPADIGAFVTSWFQAVQFGC